MAPNTKPQQQVLLFGTFNPHKLEEVERYFNDCNYELRGGFQYDDIGEAPEEQDTLEGNAIEKAQYYCKRTGMACFADDTGLEVAALDGAPGVMTARYAGTPHDPIKNMKKLLEAMEGVEDRSACFRTVIAYVGNDGTCKTFEGRMPGRIAESRSGSQGFGYDPIFIPEGQDRTFADMSLEEKNLISHRSKAITAFVDYLNKQG